MNTHSRKIFMRQRGFSMVEMMVALVVGLIVLAGIGQIFIKTKRASVLQDELARMQENSRYAIQLLNEEIRSGGYLGCRHASSITPAYMDTGGGYTDNFALGVEGYEANGTAPGDTFALDTITPGWSGGSGTEPSLTTTPLGSQPLTPGSDIIIIRYAHGPGLMLAQDKQNSNTLLVNDIFQNTCDNGTTGHSGLCVDDVAIISDCERVRTFTIGALAPGSGNQLTVSDKSGDAWLGEKSSAIPFTVADSALFEGRTVAFFVRNNAANTPALYRKIGGGTGSIQELVEGVENMQVVYGEDSDGDGVANQYHTASDVTNFANIVSVRLSLILRTLREASRGAPATETLSILSASATTPADRHHRRIFTTTIQLRNPNE